MRRDFRPTALLALACAAGALLLSACATAPTHPALVQASRDRTLPPLVPMRRFVANIDTVGGRVLSPDGRKLSMRVQTVGTDVGLAVRDSADGGHGAVGQHAQLRHRHAGERVRLHWLPDSRHIAYLKDASGDENTQIFVLDSQSPEARPWAVTPWPGVRSAGVIGGAPGSPNFFFASNRNDRTSLDLFERRPAHPQRARVARGEPGQPRGRSVRRHRREPARACASSAASTAADLLMELRQADGGATPLQDHRGLRCLRAAAHRPRRRPGSGRSATSSATSWCWSRLTSATGAEKVAGRGSRRSTSGPLSRTSHCRTKARRDAWMTPRARPSRASAISTPRSTRR